MTVRKAKQQLKPLDLKKLRKDMQTIMTEIDRMENKLDDHYSPVMWQRLQDRVDRVCDAIQAVRMILGGKTSKQAALQLGLKTQQAAAFLAWNTMLNPNWASPGEIVEAISCQFCGAPAGTDCRMKKYTGRIHGSRRVDFHKERKLRKAS